MELEQHGGLGVCNVCLPKSIRSAHGCRSHDLELLPDFVSQSPEPVTQWKA